MFEVLDPAQPSLIRSLNRVQAVVHDFYAALAPAEFVAALADAWSPAQNLDHLIKSAKPVVTALRLPKFMLRRMFGTAQQSSRTYAEIQAIYVAALARGGQASGRFVADSVPDATDAAAYQQHVLRTWDKTLTRLVRQVQRWSEHDLDQYVLPHPLLGKLTVREILFFTVYHSQRHISPEGD